MDNCQVVMNRLAEIRVTSAKLSRRITLSSTPHLSLAQDRVHSLVTCKAH